MNTLKASLAATMMNRPALPPTVVPYSEQVRPHPPKVPPPRRRLQIAVEEPPRETPQPIKITQAG